MWKLPRKGHPYLFKLPIIKLDFSDLSPIPICEYINSILTICGMLYYMLSGIISVEQLGWLQASRP